MITIDGSAGEGGGQILRTALSLSMCLQQPVRVQNIRAGRKRPGLMRQHLAAVRAATQVSAASVQGDEIGSTHLEFCPQEVSAGNYRVAIGSAGSTTLVLQTILPALLSAPAASSVDLEGGTHNGMAPSFDFLRLSFAPLLARIGVGLELNLERHGFYPNGGGRFNTKITPSDHYRPLCLLDAAQNAGPEVHLTYAHLQESIVRREATYMQRKAALQTDAIHIHQVDSLGPGNIVSLRAPNDGFENLFEAYAARGVKAERVAGRALSDYRRFRDAQVAVDQHLADQLLVPMLLGAGGEFLTHSPTLHTRTNIDVIRQISGQAIALEQVTTEQIVVRVPSPS